MFFPLDLRPNHADTLLELGPEYISQITPFWPSEVKTAIDGASFGRKRSVFQMYEFSLSGILKDKKCQYLIDFILARRGNLQSFLIKNPLEHRIVRRELALSGFTVGVARYGEVRPTSATNKAYQIYCTTQLDQTLRDNGSPIRKPIYKPAGTVKIFNAVGSQLAASDFVVDCKTGRVYFDTALNRDGFTVECEYYTPVRIKGSPEISFLNNEATFTLDSTLPIVKGQSSYAWSSVNRISIDSLTLCEVNLTQLDGDH